jgi:hypothetical protein
VRRCDLVRIKSGLTKADQVRSDKKVFKE